jgi:hypothetical protein
VEVKALVRETVEKFGQLDIADRLIAINLKGVWLCLKYEIQQKLKQETLARCLQRSTLCQSSGGRIADGGASLRTAGIRKFAIGLPCSLSTQGRRRRQSGRQWTPY